MYKIIKILLIASLGLLSFTAKAQYPSPIFKPTQFEYIYANKSLGIPDDTLPPPLAVQSKPHLALKNGTMYRWNPSTLMWQPYSGGGGGANVYPGFAMFYVNDSTLAVDTTVLKTIFLTKSDTLNKWVNSIYRLPGIDSIYFKVGNVVHAVYDSSGGGTTDSAIYKNGLTRVADTVKIGGALTDNNTVITGAGYTKSLTFEELNGVYIDYFLDIQGIKLWRGSATRTVFVTSDPPTISNLASGSDNTAFGYGASKNLNGAIANVAIGTRALNVNTNGNNNVAVGSDALWTPSSMDNSVAIGRESMQQAVNGQDNTAVGYQSYLQGSGNQNVAVGAYSLYSAVGPSIGFNTAVGDHTLFSNTTGNGNVAVGTNALLSNTTGLKNTALGSGAAENITTGSWNTALGQDAMLTVTDGIRNIAIGWNSGKIIHGNQNVSIGYLAGASVTGYSSNNTFIGGFQTGNNALQATTVHNSIALGSGAYTTASNQMVLGSDSISDTRIFGLNRVTSATWLSSFDSATKKVSFIRASDLGVGGSVSSWSTTGNAGLDTTNFIGNTDNKWLTFKTNNVIAARVRPFGSTYFGYQAGLHDVHDSTDNVGIGTRALFNASSIFGGTTGGASVGVGYEALYSQSTNTGGNNVAIGWKAGHETTTGYANVFAGLTAGYGNTTGIGNVGVGVYTGNALKDGYSNIFIGQRAGQNNTNGFINTFIGRESGNRASGQVGSIAVTAGGSGYTTATVTIAAPDATNVGGLSGGDVQATATANISGGEITSITITNRGLRYSSNPTVTITGDGTGATATATVIVPEGNVGLGAYALFQLEAGDNNVAIGRHAGYGNGGNESSLHDSLNSFFGAYSGRSNSLPQSTILNKSTAIGYNAKVYGNKQIVLGATGSDQPNIGIGTENPDKMLTVNGYGKFTDTLKGNVVYADAKFLTIANNRYSLWDMYDSTRTIEAQVYYDHFFNNMAFNNKNDAGGFVYIVNSVARGSVDSNGINMRNGRFGTSAYADPSAVVDMVHTAKGFLKPRMNTTQMNAISSPATGLEIFNTDSLKTFYYTGSAWVTYGNGGGGGGGGITGFTDGNGFDGTVTGSNLSVTTSLTTGSVPFIGASGALTQNNANFFWDNTNNRLGIGINSSLVGQLHIANAGSGFGVLVEAVDGTKIITDGSGFTVQAENLNTQRTIDVVNKSFLLQHRGSGTFKLTADGTTDIEVAPAGGAVKLTTNADDPYQFTNNDTGGIGGSGYFPMGRYYAPNMGGGNIAQYILGKQSSTNDAYSLDFHYASPGSTSNWLGIGFYANNDLIRLDAAGNFGIAGINASYKFTNTGTSLFYAEPQFETQLKLKDIASPSTPPAGYGYPFVRDDSLRFKNDSGEEFTLGRSTGGSGGMADPGSNGIVVRTALNTTSARTITGTTNKITVTDGNGVSGNPTITVGSDIVDETQANTYTAGMKQTFRANGTNAGLNIEFVSEDPSGLAAGDMWFSTINNTLNYYDNVTTVRALVNTDASQTLTNKTIAGGSNNITGLSLTTAVTGTLPIANGGTNATTANAALNNLLPSQSGNSGKMLVTGGTNATWDYPSGLLLNIQVLTSGTTYTPTSGTNSAVLYLLGAGGGGGGASGSASSVGAAGGGGGGSLVIKRITGVTGTYTYAIGTAGSAGANSGGNGGNGGSTTFTNGGTTYTAPGGSGGTGQTAGTALSVVAGGAGGAVGTNGDMNGAGQPGNFGYRASGTFGYSGSGGSSEYGGGGLMLIAAAAGNNGTGYGAGGGGALSTANTNRAGGAGTQGIIIVFEYR